MTPFEQAVTEIELFGFTLIQNVLEQDEIGALREALKRSAETAGKPDYVNRNGTSLVVLNLPTLDPAMHRGLGELNASDLHLAGD